MPDISKCEGINCPIKKKCYRFTSKPNEFMQSYSDLTDGLNKLKTQCKYFLGIWKPKI